MSAAIHSLFDFRKNPRAADDITHRAPEELVASILEKEAEIARILAWHRNRTTLQALARELNVCASTVRKVIRSEGRDYKQPPPEQRAEVLQALRRQREELAMEERA